MIITHTHAKGEGQRSLGSKVRVNGQTDRQTEAIALPRVPVPTRSVNIGCARPFCGISVRGNAVGGVQLG